MEAHSKSVLTIANQIAKFHAQKTPFRIYHGSTNSTRSTTFSDATSVNISGLNNVISVNPQACTCLVEANVPMDALVAATLPFKLIPPVVPEFPGITIGGAFAGTGGESSSFRYDFFDQCVKWVEIVLANGEVVIASPTEDPDLFWGSAGTFGTLGVATLFEINLIPAKDFVKVTYHQVQSFIEAQKMFTSLQSCPQTDFVDGIMFSKTIGVIVAGTLVDYDHYQRKTAPPIANFSRPRDQWFYLHAQDVLSQHPASSPPHEELIPTTSYLFRYDRGAFWTGFFVFQWFGIPFNRLTRFLLDWLMSTRILYHGLHASGLGDGYMIQDLCLPEATAEQFLNWLDAEYAVYPLWLCPMKQNKRVSMNPHIPSPGNAGETNGEALLNIGVWAPCPPGDRVSVNRTVEAKLRSLGGMKWLYADTFYTEEEFWSIYDRKWYTDLRRKYGAAGLPDVYQKVRTVIRSPAQVRNHVEASSSGAFWGSESSVAGLWTRFCRVWPLPGVMAVYSALRGVEYLKERG
jgi:delta24-sterol reductase